MKKQILFITTIMLLSVTALFANDYASRLKITRLSKFANSINIGFDRNPWGGNYTAHNFHCIIKKPIFPMKIIISYLLLSCPHI